MGLKITKFEKRAKFLFRNSTCEKVWAENVFVWRLKTWLFKYTCMSSSIFLKFITLVGWAWRPPKVMWTYRYKQEKHERFWIRSSEINWCAACPHTVTVALFQIQVLCLHWTVISLLLDLLSFSRSTSNQETTVTYRDINVERPRTGWSLDPFPQHVSIRTVNVVVVNVPATSSVNATHSSFRRTLTITTGFLDSQTPRGCENYWNLTSPSRKSRRAWWKWQPNMEHGSYFNCFVHSSWWFFKYGTWAWLIPVMTTAVNDSRFGSSLMRVFRSSSSLFKWLSSPICTKKLILMSGQLWRQSFAFLSQHVYTSFLYTSFLLSCTVGKQCRWETILWLTYRSISDVTCVNGFTVLLLAFEFLFGDGELVDILRGLCLRDHLETCIEFRFKTWPFKDSALKLSPLLFSGSYPRRRSNEENRLFSTDSKIGNVAVKRARCRYFFFFDKSVTPVQKKQVRLVSVEAERRNHPSRRGGSSRGGGLARGGGGPPWQRRRRRRTRDSIRPFRLTVALGLKNREWLHVRA